jgi:adenylosuccinate synthase
MSGVAAARAVAVVDMGFGDAGKGLITDYLVRHLGARTVVRFNGGAQAGHNVVTPDGRHHTFSQFGSGTFVPGVRTHLARHVVLHPTALLVEAQRLADVGVTDALSRLTVSEQAKVVTPFHQAAGRLLELVRGDQRHGSCGVGVGEVMRDAGANPEDAVRVEHLMNRASLRARLARVQERMRAGVADQLERSRASMSPAVRQEVRMLDDPGVIEAWIDATQPFVAQASVASDATLRRALESPVIFEGAQGVLLDEAYGFHPFTTWSNCTFGNVDELLRDLGGGMRATRVGVVRTYAHRHGPGPLPTESVELTGALHEPHNVDGPWQGPFRAGWTDLVLARYARTVCGAVDAVALTHLDALAGRPEWRVAVAYQGGSVTEWPVLRTEELAARAEQTRQLSGMEPVYEEQHSASPEARTRWVEGALREAFCAPVQLTSHGPRAEDVKGRLSFTSR